MATLPLLITPGDPAGIGPDLVIALAHSKAMQQRAGLCDAQGLARPWCAIADPDVLRMRAKLLGVPVSIEVVNEPDEIGAGSGRYVLPVLALPAAVPVHPGISDRDNAAYVLACLDKAVALLRSGSASAMVTGPVAKSVIVDGGFADFTGHTEYLARQSGVDQVVMMLVAKSLRVALVTTHLPLAAVPAAISREHLMRVLRILLADLRSHWGMPKPKVLVAGLNPHAGESGHLGREEIEVIEPVLASLRAEGHALEGPLPADTLFTPQHLAQADCVLAMYHDQGLPVLKHVGFGDAVNVTLGLPFIRTSVDHGTAFDLAGSGKADPGSLLAACALACELDKRRTAAA